MLDAHRQVGIATVVIRTRQHIAVLYPRDKSWCSNTLRYANELRDPEGPQGPQGPQGREGQPNEIKMAERLIDDMSMEWEPEEYHDTYRDDLLKMIEEKAHGKLKKAPKAKRAPREAEVIDFAVAPREEPRVAQERLGRRQRRGRRAAQEDRRKARASRPQGRRAATSPRRMNRPTVRTGETT